MTRIKQILSKWSARRQAATPGPWYTSLCNSGESCWCRVVSTVKDSDKLGDCIAPSGSLSKIDAEFIAASRTEHARLTKALERAVEALNDWRKWSAEEALTDIEKILEGEGE